MEKEAPPFLCKSIVVFLLTRLNAPLPSSVAVLGVLASVPSVTRCARRDNALK